MIKSLELNMVGGYFGGGGGSEGGEGGTCVP